MLKSFTILFSLMVIIQEGKTNLYEISEDYLAFLEQCRPTIQENIVSAFNNEMARNHRRRNFIKTVHLLDSILLSVDNTKIELSDLKLPWLPDFKVINLTVNLVNLCLDIHFKLGDLNVNGNYEANNVTLQKQLPVSHNGDVSVNFSDVSVKGKVGLLIQGDSFVPKNYDIDYSWTESEVKYFVGKDTQVESKITGPVGELVLADKIWLQLKEVLTSILHDQLVGVVVEYSVTESLADEDKTLRDYARYQVSKANGLFDTLLCSAKDYLVEKDYRRIATSPFQVIYRGKLTSTEQGIFQSGDGFITDLSTLSRLSDLSLFEDEHQFHVYGTLGLRDFKHGYEHFSTKFEDNELTGTINTQIYSNEIFIKLSFEKNAENVPKPKVEKIEVRLIKEAEVDTSGLGSLSWLIPKTHSWVVGHLRTNVMSNLLKYFEEAFSYAIEQELKKSQSGEPDNEKSKLFWTFLFSSK
ncbi:uncharacterized protein LOC115888569 isoform X2 [Sitophilus oryzae]|uniref:Uncharacterized protein LOC115888569 isoform X2 n=1 Tax=Sitophilus oryzae TaxID=7048 RepID=A0A6J2YMZ3_SITOR|nr:uncharacterized protein LOC115888569 isoform X2 [Sitophilus oryzae]